MSDSFKKIKGFADIYGEENRKFTRIEEAAREVFPLYDFKELRTPILESTGLFQRSIGAETDVVQKEMFTFLDRKERSLTLRPEATAGVLRACIEDNLIKPNTILRFFTIGPMFRYERPQKGRMRQFHQVNCECIGSDSPYADAEVICMLLDFLQALELKNLKLKINSLGCRECRAEYLDKLRDFLTSCNETDFCEDCRKRISANPLRVLDCKQTECRELTRNAPKLLEHNCRACKEHIEKVMDLLTVKNVEVEIDHHLVRGLDYYARTTFEVVSDQIGSQTAVAGGGRYDGLIEQLGGPAAPAVGFACGMERLALLLNVKEPKPLNFYLLTPQKEQRDLAYQLAQFLREHGLAGEMNYADGSFKSLMRQASRSGAKYCLIIGPDEAAREEFTLKDMKSGEQKNMPFNRLVAAVYSNDTPFEIKYVFDGLLRE